MKDRMSLEAAQDLMDCIIDILGLLCEDKFQNREHCFESCCGNGQPPTVLRMLEHMRGEEDLEIMQRGLTAFLSLGYYIITVFVK